MRRRRFASMLSTKTIICAKSHSFDLSLVTVPPAAQVLHTGSTSDICRHTAYHWIAATHLRLELARLDVFCGANRQTKCFSKCKKP